MSCISDQELRLEPQPPWITFCQDLLFASILLTGGERVVGGAVEALGGVVWREEEEAGLLTEEAPKGSWWWI